MKKKGFTLIELMIVLAIIAILAVVLVPKAGQMKDNGRNSGVTTNVNAVRATLEAKVVDSTYLGSYASTYTLLSNSFNATNGTSLVNPFNAKGTTINPNNVAVNTSSPGYSLVVFDHSSVSVTNYPTDATNWQPATPANKGVVYVYVYSDGYVVFGVDSTNTVVDVATIK